MIHFFKITSEAHIKNNGRYSWKVLIVLFLLTCLAGCHPALSQEIYKNPERGISLVKPDNWDLEYFDRNGEIVLEAKIGFLKKKSTRIEIVVPLCGHNPGSQNSLSEELKFNIERIQKLYNLDSIIVLEGPLTVQTGEYKVSKAIIEIPTMSMPQNSSRIQVGERSSDKKQIINLVAIDDQNNPIMTYIYKGDNEVLNAQALEIINSIRRTCLPEQ